jgi:hypothetical protein
MSILGSIFKKGGAVEKITDIVDQAVEDKDKSKELKVKIIELMASLKNPITPFVRAIIGIEFITVWIFYPQNFEGREDTAQYVLYGIIGFYFLADFAIDKWKGK